MEKFIAIYRAPTDVLDEWMKTDEATRKQEEEKMKSEWDAWVAEHASSIKETLATGKTKSVGKDGTTDSRNDMMLYSIIEAESHEAAAKLFEGHPHFGIPGATVDVMPIRSM